MTRVKHHQRLDHGRLAEVLHERGIANVDVIRDLLQQSREGGMAFCDALVATNLVADWDLSRIVCETFSLPFLPIDMVEPNAKLRSELDLKLFRQHMVVPLDRFGQVLTVIMPALVQADVLAQLAAASDLVILPVVGTVETNRRWMQESFGDDKTTDIEGGWGNLFDQADAAVNAALSAFAEMGDGPSVEHGTAPGAARPALGNDGTRLEDLQFDIAAVEADDDGLDLGLDVPLGDEGGFVPPQGDDHDDDEVDAGAASPRGPRAPGAEGGFELPPMPDFGGGRQAG